MQDIIIAGGLVVDGSGGAPYHADVLVRGGYIQRIEPGLPSDGAQIIDATGCAVSPGFIDTHRHIDAALLRQGGYGEIELRQGITSAISGNCGFSLFPCFPGHEADLHAFLRPIVGNLDALEPFESADAFLTAVELSRPAINAGTLMGNGALRIALNGYTPGPMSEAQMQQAEALIARAMDEGAFGLSMGLMYAPENNYEMGQLVRLARAMGGRGLLAMHIRGEGQSLVSSIEEALQIARLSGARLQISHFKAAGHAAWGAPYQKAKALIEVAIEAGQDVMVDVYPYEAGSTSLLTLLPPAWLAGGIDALMGRLCSPTARIELAQILLHEQPDWDNIVASVGFESIRIASLERPENQALIGRDLKSAAREMGISEAELISDLIISERGNVSIVNFIVSEDNLVDALGLNYAFYISDSILSGGKPHPRYCGAFPKILRKCVREDGFSLGEAIKRMTSLPAERYGIAGRGLIRPGYCADLCVFDPEAVSDHADYAHSERMATGFLCVLVNGEIAVYEDKVTGARSGHALRPNQ